MHPVIRKSLFPLVAVGLAACSDSSQPLPQEVDFQFTAGPACDYRPVKKDARDYFPKSLDRTVQGMIRDMQHADDADLATDIGFDILALVAQITKDTLQDGTFQDGSDLTNGLLACMTFEDDPGPDEAPGTADDIPTAPPAPIDFTGALDAGAYDVRGGSGDPNEPVVSHLCEYDPSVPCPEETWGAEPAFDLGDPDPRTWSDVTGGERLLIYGAETTPPAGGETQLTETFDWNTVPLLVGGFEEDVRVARCTPEDEGGKERVQRGSGVPFILPFSEPSFCAFSESAPSFGAGLLGSLKRWTHTATSLLMPQPLYASAVAPGRCCGGATSDWSPFVVVTGGNVNLTFETQPADTVIDPATSTAAILDAEGNAIVVSAKGDNGTPLPEVTITISVEVNQGSWVVLGGDTEETTDVGCSSTSGCIPSGTVSFGDLTLNKPGGYRLVASASLFGYDLAVIASDAFHIGQ